MAPLATKTMTCTVCSKCRDKKIWAFCPANYGVIHSPKRKKILF